MAKGDNALAFLGTILIEGTSGTGWAVTSTAITERTRMTLGQKVLAKTVTGLLGGAGLALLGVPRIGGGVANAALVQLGEGLAAKVKLNQKVDRLLSGNSNAANGTTPSGALGSGNARNRNPAQRGKVTL